jgi:hypothetical protein
MHQQVELAYAAMDRSDLQVIQGDLWHNNIKLNRGRLHPSSPGGIVAWTADLKPWIS